MEILFHIQLVRSYWTEQRDGVINFNMLRADLDDRIKILNILAEHGIDVMSIG